MHFFPRLLLPVQSRTRQNASCLPFEPSDKKIKASLVDVPDFLPFEDKLTTKMESPCAEQQMSVIRSSLHASPLSLTLCGDCMANVGINPDTWTVSGAAGDMGSSSLSTITRASSESTTSRSKSDIVSEQEVVQPLWYFAHRCQDVAVKNYALTSTLLICGMIYEDDLPPT